MTGSHLQRWRRKAHAHWCTLEEPREEEYSPHFQSSACSNSNGRSYGAPRQPNLKLHSPVASTPRAFGPDTLMLSLLKVILKLR